MKTTITKLFFIVALIGISTFAKGQTITSVTLPNNPNDCSNSTITLDLTQLCLNYVWNGVSHNLNGSTITVTAAWTTNSPICLGALAFLNPSHNMGQLPSGSYTLNVVTTLDGVPQQSQSFQLNIASCCPANAAIQGSAANVCTGDTVLLVNTSSNATASAWSQNGNTISTSDSVYFSFTTPGTYPIQLAVTDGTCADSVTYNINVTDYPNVDLGPDTSTCQGQSILLSPGAPIAGATYQWSTSATSSTITVNTANTYAVTVTDNGCASSDSVVVAAKVGPSPVNLGNDTTLCAGSPLMLDATSSTSGVSYNWSNNATTPTLSVTSSNTYTVTVTSPNNCFVTDNIVVNFETVPMPNLGPDTIVCEGNAYLLNGFATGAATFQWSTGATSANLSVDTSGTYTVTAFSPIGCSGSDDVTITVEALPMPNLGADTTLCDGAMLTLDATATGAATYAWSSGATTSSITVDSANTYTVTATTANGCSNSDNITVNYSTISVDLGADTIDITAGQVVTLDAGVTGVTYLWSTNETTQTIVVSATGTYSVTVTDAFGCTASSSVLITNSTNTQSILNEKVKLYPNPTSDYLVLETTMTNLQGATILNGFGQVVGQVDILNNKQLSVSHLASGVYYLQLQTTSGEVLGTTRFVKL